MKDDFHERCVKYHDLIKTLMNILMNVLNSTGITQQQESERLLQTLVKESNQLTMNKNEIKALIRKIKDANIEARLNVFVDYMEKTNLNFNRLYKVQNEVQNDVHEKQKKIAEELSKIAATQSQRPTQARQLLIMQQEHEEEQGRVQSLTQYTDLVEALLLLRKDHGYLREGLDTPIEYRLPQHKIIKAA